MEWTDNCKIDLFLEFQSNNQHPWQRILGIFSAVYKIYGMIHVQVIRKKIPYRIGYVSYNMIIAKLQNVQPLTIYPLTESLGP